MIILSVDQSSAADVGKSLDPTLVNTPYTGNYTGAHGILHLNGDGTFTYTATGGGSDQFVFTIRDGDGFITKAVLNVTAVSANHPALIGDPIVHEVTEDTAVNGSGNLTASGTISITDADQNQASFQTTVTPAAGNLGSLVLQTNGTYTYTVANAAVQFLGAGGQQNQFKPPR